MAAQPLLGCGNDRPDDSDEPPAVFYIESTSQDHQEAPGMGTGTSTTAKSSITRASPRLGSIVTLSRLLGSIVTLT